MTAYGWVVALPFLAALIGLLGGRRIPGGPAVPAVAGTLAATVLAVWQAVGWHGLAERALATIPTGGPELTVLLRIDGRAAGVAVMVCCVALAVQVYSIGYMRGDPRYSSYAAFVSLFTAAMLLVVVSGDLLVLYVGWEVMGVCSYFLIGHYWEERYASRAAVKAFLMTRVGDVGFLFGVFVLAGAAGSFRIGTVLAAVPHMPPAALTAATLLLILGVAGKSAQFPLHSWLPDAMAGPTPISALIHAATMVAAGVYVVARLEPAFVAAPASAAVLALVATVSMVGAALAALAQRDLKRVLAYSTISQLAYMAAALAAGGADAATYHLHTHAAFKALLFLCAGAVIHAVGSNDLADFGGLRRRMPITFVTMTIGFAALAAFPPFAGFFSKEAVLGSLLHTTVLPAPVAVITVAGAFGTIALTAAYATRAWLMTFFGPARAPSAHDAGWSMTGPLVALAVPALALGLVVLPRFHPGPEVRTGLAGTVLALAGALGAWAVWRRDPAADPARVLGPLRAPFEAAFGVDTVYAAVVVRPARALARAVVRVDDQVVDAAVEGTGRSARGLGGLLRRTQMGGNAQAYLTGLLAGVVLIVVLVGVFG